MAISSRHVVGFAVGIGAAGVGYYLYRKNEDRVHLWLRRQGFNIPMGTTKNFQSMSLEELIYERERLEDLIAERKKDAGIKTPTEIKVTAKKAD